MPARPNHPPVWDVKAGDTGTTLLAELLGLDDTGNLAAVTGVAGRIWPAGQPTAAVALTGAVNDSANRLIELETDGWLDTPANCPVPASDDDPTEYHLVAIISTSDEDPFTWPERGYGRVRVWTPGSV